MRNMAAYAEYEKLNIALAINHSFLYPGSCMVDLLYEDKEILVIDKPAGLPSQPGERVKSSVVSVCEAQFGFHPFLVHRLDKETAGCMILAKDSAAATRWALRIGTRDIRKRYRAICLGGPVRKKGSYSDDLLVDGKVQATHTDFLVLSRFGSLDGISDYFSLMEFELGTGRTHQIRRHAAMHGHPILWDDKYGDFSLNRRLKHELGIGKLLLWAFALDIPGFPTLRSATPAHFSAFMKAWESPQETR
jgi:23S rRNA pseudouridine955/2504/2580 synthase